MEGVQVNLEKKWMFLIMIVRKKLSGKWLYECYQDALKDGSSE